MSTFNFPGGQHAGQINNVGRDQIVNGGMTANTAFGAGAAELADLRRALGAVPLTADQHAEVTVELDGLSQSLGTGQAAGRLERLTRRLKQWGALAGAGESVIGPLLRLAGTVGAGAVRGMIGG